MLQQWCRQRARQGGLPRPSAVHTVSSLRGTGVPALLDDLRQLVGEHGDVWVGADDPRDVPEFWHVPGPNRVRIRV